MQLRVGIFHKAVMQRSRMVYCIASKRYTVKLQGEPFRLPCGIPSRAPQNLRTISNRRATNHASLAVQQSLHKTAAVQQIVP